MTTAIVCRVPISTYPDEIVPIFKCVESHVQSIKLAMSNLGIHCEYTMEYRPWEDQVVILGHFDDDADFAVFQLSGL